MITLKFNIGYKFTYHKRDYKIIDIHTITDSKGKIIRRYYITESFTCGQSVRGEMPEALIIRAK